MSSQINKNNKSADNFWLAVVIHLVRCLESSPGKDLSFLGSSSNFRQRTSRNFGEDLFWSSLKFRLGLWQRGAVWVFVALKTFYFRLYSSLAQRKHRCRSVTVVVVHIYSSVTGRRQTLAVGRSAHFSLYRLLFGAVSVQISVQPVKRAAEQWGNLSRRKYHSRK